MPKPRNTQISLEATPYYHCISRCVRRAFLCGTDDVTGQNYEHRRQLIEDKLLELAGIFSLDVCAYAIMSNHYHVVLHVDKSMAENWNMDEVIQHWHQLFSGNRLSQRYRSGDTLSKPELIKLDECVTLWRERLMDISWLWSLQHIHVPRDTRASMHIACVK